jgi:hypothetical protein
MSGRCRVLLRIVDGETSRELAQVRQAEAADAAPVVVILRSGTIAKEEPLTGDPEQTFILPAVNGRKFGIHARDIERAINEGRTAIPLDHPSSPRAVIGYRTTESNTERAAEIRLSFEESALDHWRGKNSAGMVRFHEERVEEARQELARIRRDTQKRRRHR